MTGFPVSDVCSSSTHQILGIRFFNGDVDEAVALMFERGGFIVAPSGTCFADVFRAIARGRTISAGRACG